MSKLFSNALIITVMLVSLVGQAFAASAMSCEMASNAHPSHMNMNTMMDHSAMGHDGMMHDDMTRSDDSADDCCEVTCFCPTNACTSVTLVNTDTAATGVVKFSEAVIGNRAAQPNAISTSLFRPPIFA
ncbi:hypothetical protein [Pseudoalteromonas sp. GB56]